MLFGRCTAAWRPDVGDNRYSRSAESYDASSRSAANQRTSPPEYHETVSDLRIRVLGPVTAERGGVVLALSKARHREILGVLVAARGRPVSTRRLIDALWVDSPAGAVGSIRTFIAELRIILEPGRLARSAPLDLVTIGDGYALRLAPDAVDLWRVEQALRSTQDHSLSARVTALDTALDEWRGRALDEFRDRDWAASERAHSAELHATTVEQLAQTLLELGQPQRAIELVDRNVVQLPWREEGWRLLALGLYRCGRQAEALAVIARARTALVDQLGLDPGPALIKLERAILGHDPALIPTDNRTSNLLQTVSSSVRTNPRSQLESASTLLPLLALSGSVRAAAERRLAVIAEAEEFGDPELVARVVGGFDVPGSWTTADDPVSAAAVVEAASRALNSLRPSASPRVRARLLATIAMEARGTASRLAEAVEAERIARRLADPALLGFALSARFMQTFDRTGRAAARNELGVEIIAISVTADLPTFELEGRLIRMQALCALQDIPAAEQESDLIDALASRYDRPLASEFTSWFRFSFLGGPAPLLSSEMPGFSAGLAGLERLTRGLWSGRQDPGTPPTSASDLGPYEPWARPLLLARCGEVVAASAALAEVPDPPHDLMMEVLWCLIGHAAIATVNPTAAKRAYEALLPAAQESAAGSGAVNLGPIGPLLRRLAATMTASS
jgi:DNA-binding SARP family transcriptional activator